MDKHFPVSQFDAIYLIDLCEPLLDVARKRFARKGWRNITVLCQDATEFSLPEWAATDPKGSVSFITLSYSLSMVSTLSPLVASNVLTPPLDSKLLCAPRSHRLCPLSGHGLARRRRLLHLRTPAFPARESDRRDQQRMWLAQPLVLANLVRL